jgi:hypothetical protein
VLREGHLRRTYGDSQIDELTRESGQSLVSTSSPPKSNNGVLSFNKSSFLQPLAERRDHSGRLVGGSTTEKSKQRYFSIGGWTVAEPVLHGSRAPAIINCQDGIVTRLWAAI